MHPYLFYILKVYQPFQWYLMTFSFDVTLYRGRGREIKYAVILSVPHGKNPCFPLVTRLIKKKVPYLSTDYVSYPEINITIHWNLVGPSYFTFKKWGTDMSVHHITPKNIFPIPIQILSGPFSLTQVQVIILL